MASAPVLSDLASDAFPAIAAAAGALGMGPADRVRLEAVALRLLSEGIGADDPRVPLWFAAALCRSAEQRRVFLAVLGIEHKPDKPPIREIERKPDAPIADSEAVDEFIAAKRRGVLLTVAAVALGQLLVFLALWWLQAPKPSPPVQTDNLTIPAEQITQVPVPKQAATMVADWASISALIVVLAVALGYWLWRRRKIREIKANFTPQPDKAAPLALRHEETRLFGSQAIRAGLRRLRRHRSQPGGKLDVRASIAATIRAGGQPQARLRGRWLMPEYLLLAEREAPRDHLAEAGKALADRIKSENVAIGHYEFRTRPDRLRAAIGGQASTPLASIIARHADARSMLLAESFDLRRGALTPVWADRLADAGPVVHLNPRLDGGRAESEALLAEDGIDSFPLTGRGIAAMAQRLADPRGRHGLLAGGPARYDLARDFDRERKLLLGEETPSDAIVAGVLEDLTAWLDPDAYRWFASLALFPYLEPALTLYVGSHLRNVHGEAVLTDARYLALARLPWMRVGGMPRWLRVALAQSLDAETLASAAAAIQAFLLPEVEDGQASAIAIETGRDPARRRVLLTWLTASPESEFHDRILIDMFRGRSPGQLGERPTDGLSRRLQRWRENPAVRFYAVVATALALVMIARPPAPTVTRDTDETELVNMRQIDDRPTPVPTVSPSASPTEDLPPENTSYPVENVVVITPTPKPTFRPTPRPSPTASPAEEVPSLFIVYFDWDKADLTPEAVAILDNAVAATRKMPGGRFEISIKAYTDTEGTQAYALGLSRKMAVSVRNYLVSRGIAPELIKSEAFGSNRPAVPTPPGVREPANRRVEIILETPVRLSPLDQLEQRGIDTTN